MEGLPLFIDDHHRYYAPLTPPPPSAPSPRPHSRQRCRVGAPAPPPSLCLPTTQPPGAHRVFHQRQAGLVEAVSAGSAQWRPGLGETRGVVGERRGPGGSRLGTDRFPQLGSDSAFWWRPTPGARLLWGYPHPHIRLRSCPVYCHLCCPAKINTPSHSCHPLSSIEHSGH